MPDRLAGALLPLLRTHFDDDVVVLAERHRRDRRIRGERRVATGDPPAVERRRIRHSDGRRIGERRALMVPTPPLGLPAQATPQAPDICFYERLERGWQELEDDDTARLVTRIQAGCSAELELLYARYVDRVYGYLRLLLRDPHDAEDVTQQAFVRVLEALPRYERRQQPFRAWLFTIVRHEGLSLLRRRRTDPVDPAELARCADGSLDYVGADVLGWVSDRDLTMLIERLPLAQRQVLMLRYMMDLGNVDIARVLGRTPNDVAALNSRALKYLRQRLTALRAGPPARPHAPAGDVAPDRAGC